VVTWILIGLTVVIAYTLLQSPDGGAVEVAYSRFKALLVEGKVDTVVFRGDRISGTFHSAIEAVPGTTSDRFTTRMLPVNDPDLLHLLDEHGVKSWRKSRLAGQRG